MAETIEQVTGEQVLAAMVAADINRVDHHECGICGFMTHYARTGDRLFFNPGCGCSWRGSEPRSWDGAAHWINMQRTPEKRQEVAALFGL